MSIQKYILTIIANDAPGIVRSVSKAVQQAGGNWLESSMNRLGGQFAGIARIELEASAIIDLQQTLSSLASQGIVVTIHEAVEESAATDASDTQQSISLTIEANDRPGIVEEISGALASIDINVEEMTTYCESASMAGYTLFVADIEISLPTSVSIETLESALEAVSDDLMVETFV